MTSLTLTSQPGEEPVSLQEAKDHLRVTSSDDDAYIAALIVTVRKRVEHHTNRGLITQTWEQKHDAFPPRDDMPIQLCKNPVQSVTSIEYEDIDGNTQTWSSGNYQVFADNGVTKIAPSPDVDYPDTEDERRNAVTITYKVGYGDDWNDVPDPIKQAMFLWVGHLYENRESINIGGIVNKVPQTAVWLLDPYRVAWF